MEGSLGPVYPSGPHGDFGWKSRDGCTSGVNFDGTGSKLGLPLQTVEELAMAHPSRAAWGRRLRPIEWVATIAFAWSLVITSLDSFSIYGANLSRTRELTTSYVLIVTALVVLPWRQWSRPLRLTVALLGGSIFVGFLVWQASEGSFMAANYWPQWLIPLGMLLLGLSYGRELWWLWRRLILLSGLSVAVFNMLMILVDWRASGPLGGADAFYGSRPIGAHLALLMVISAVLALTESSLSAKMQNILTAFLGTNVVLAQHRSAWGALLVALLLLFARYSLTRVKLANWWSVPVVGGFFIVVALLPFFAPVSVLRGGSQQGSALPDSFESTGSLSWRLDMWEARIEQSRSALEWLVGGTFGSTPVWGPDSSVMNATISGHSQYVDLLTMLGLLGLMCFMYLAYLATWHKDDLLGEMPIIIWASLVYGIFYAWPAWTWALLGVASVGAGKGGVMRESNDLPTNVETGQDAAW